MAIGILIKRLDGSVTLVRKQLETLSEDPLTDHEQIINELHEQLRLCGVGVTLPKDKEDTQYWVDLVNWGGGGIEEVSNKNLLEFKSDIDVEIQKRLTK